MNLKWTRNSLLLFLWIPQWTLTVTFFGTNYTRIFSLSTSLDLNLYDRMRFPVRLSLTYGSVRWTGLFNLKFFIIEEFTTLPSNVKERSHFRYGLEVNRFFSCNRPLRNKPDQVIENRSISESKLVSNSLNFYIYSQLCFLLKVLN